MQLNRPGTIIDIMTGEAPGTSGQWVLQESASVASNDGFLVAKNARSNVSVQTGEEFSVEFLQDRIATRRIPGVSNVAQKGEQRDGIYQNNQFGYEDLTRILGLRRVDSDCPSEISEFASAKGYMSETENGSFGDKISRYQKEGSDSGHGQRRAADESNCSRAGLAPTTPPIYGTDSPHSYQPYELGVSGSQSGKMKFLCSFGGKILPRPSDGKLRYVGGETRIISIRKNLSWGELVKKTSGICNQPHTVKYQLPDEDLDALISVSSDEDLQNMIEEYEGLERLSGSRRLRIFLIPLCESENTCSFEASAIQQSNPDYQYVVAVNGIVDHSPRKNSSGLCLASEASQLETNLDCKLSFNSNSPTAHLPLERSGLNVLHPTQFLNETQNLTGSPNPSSPFSPIPVMQKDSNNVHLQSYGKNSCWGSNESNSSFVTAKQPPESPSIETAGYNHPQPVAATLMNHHHPYKQVDTSQPYRQRGVHFHDLNPSIKSVSPSVFDKNDSDFDGFSSERHTIKERTFHSENPISHLEDSMGLLSGPNDSIDSHRGMSHAFSDSKLQERGGRSVYCSQEGMSPSSPLNLSKTQLSSLLVSAAPSQEKSMQVHANIDFVNPLTQNKILDIESAGSQRRLDLCSESSGKNESIRWGNNDIDGKNQMAKEDGGKLHKSKSSAPAMEDQSEMPKINCIPTSVPFVNTSTKGFEISGDMIPASSGIDLEHFADTMLMQPQNYQLDQTLSYLGMGQKTTKDQQCAVNGIMSGEEGSDATWTRYSEVSGIFPATKRQSRDENSLTDLLSGLSSSPLSHESPGLLPVACLKDMGLQQPMQVSSADLHLSEVCDDAGPSSYLHKNILPTLSLNPTKEAGVKGDVSLLDNDIVNYSDQKVAKLVPEGFSYDKINVEGITLHQTKPHHKYNDQAQLESVVVVEDVTDTLPSGVKYSSAVVPHVVDATSSEILSPSAMEAESSFPESDSEDVNSEDGDKDESISDAVIAEIEAGIYGLQIIKNADLEELRELGSGTYGTVYHGKWRGTDVAIKRIKKSCFAGRSSEQERLTKDFWREAQILSNLHHPNVVAFYGVVPDGVGGTLATVTEFMVNGSLRHVLLKKDRSLDRRKKLMIAMDAAFGMEYLHSKNIVHFDLKCENLLVNLRDPERPICKVGDFGLSRIKRNTLVSGGVRGTLPWMAPELLNGSSSRVSEKVDVFSFGVAMWEILTGEEPYANMHCGAIIGGILKNTLRPPIPERCDSGWRKLMEQCWSPDPDTRPSFTEITSRFRSMSAVLQAKGHTSQARPMKPIIPT
ncbi:hypothetical protein L1049_003793 [Liquidambar formosana]|uniref:Protein kinase domain-containing protein n=1 Tax=Liquidambar formosana TaxID=63359 RepID=A0AAP0RMC9_LIQFO